ncbi:MAG TPA: type II toxin-antitoxin system RelE/ParE family toxin [Myxococcota bacterium]|nr:type II toxin-antitoxin system RelE/ParE family toxin [Myxococcota bacterium]HRY96178.1 type II toxin-antitoxin system RelE/ParE family toxin [Myxococcota bacterium]
MATSLSISWTGPALRDLEGIREYVAQDAPAAAKRLAGRLRMSVLRLQAHPLSGRPVPELPGTDLREVIVAPYRIVYTVRGRRVIILRVWHARREPGAR